MLESQRNPLRLHRSNAHYFLMQQMQVMHETASHLMQGRCGPKLLGAVA